MEIINLKRTIFNDVSTVGKLYFRDLELFTLEDTCRNRDKNQNGLLDANEKIKGVTAIPSGLYEIFIRDSNRYGRPMPYLKNVPFFEDIMLHWGNIPENTLGCILVGMAHSEVNTISDSRTAFNKLFPLIEDALSKGHLQIRIQGGLAAADMKDLKTAS